MIVLENLQFLFEFQFIVQQIIILFGFFTRAGKTSQFSASVCSNCRDQKYDTECCSVVITRGRTRNGRLKCEEMRTAGTTMGKEGDDCGSTYTYTTVECIW